MITKVTGVLNRVEDEEARLQVGAFEYSVLVPEYVRRRIQAEVGAEVTLHTCHFFEGNPMQGRVVPRLIGFPSEVDLEFFDLFCTVDKVGTKKALKALTRPIKEIADAIQRQDSKWLTTLPGIGAASAEQIVAKLRRKVTKFALISEPTRTNGDDEEGAALDGNMIEDAYQALLSVGHNPLDARDHLDRILATKKDYKSVEEILLAVYQSQN